VIVNTHTHTHTHTNTHIYIIYTNVYIVVERSFREQKVGGSIPGPVRLKTEILTPVASLLNGHHLRVRTGLVCPVSI